MCVAPPRMNEAHIVPGSAAANSTRRKAHASLDEPAFGRMQIVDPEAHVVQRGLVYARAPLGIDRLHQVDLRAEGAAARDGDVLVDVFGLAAVRARELEAE